MTGATLAETADFYRVDASTKLDSAKRALLGQYMTPAPIARFMASLFSETGGDIRVLDPGARGGVAYGRPCGAALRWSAQAVFRRVRMLRNRPDAVGLSPRHARPGQKAMS